MPDPTSDQSRRRRPFAAWVKKLANFKSSSSPTSGDGSPGNLLAAGAPPTSARHLRRRAKPNSSSAKQQPGSAGNNNPYPLSAPGPSSSSPHTGDSQSNSSAESLTSRSVLSVDGQGALTVESAVPTTSTDHEASHSISAPSHVTSTTRTFGGGVESRRGGDSTFSSPAPSVRSLTTTLTTIRSGTGLMTTPTANTQSTQFQPSFASALPQHLAPGNFPGHPTYSTATANGVLTDNASILTLASSSKRRRRRSLDTDASVRALAPSSLWGGSRESLPLSVLSATVDVAGGPGTPGTPGHHGMSAGSSRMERNSIYSTTGGGGVGAATTIQAERNSLYAKPSMTGAGDGASVRSGLGHGRAESVNGSINGLGSPLAVQRENVDNERQLPKEDERKEGQAPIREG